MLAREMAERLSQLQDMRREVDELSQRIARTDEMEFPSLVEILKARRQSCMEELGRLYAFIDDIQDSRMRRIFSMRYIDKLTWLQIAYSCDETDEQYPRRKHDRYLKKLVDGGASSPATTTPSRFC